MFVDVAEAVLGISAASGPLEAVFIYSVAFILLLVIVEAVMTLFFLVADALRY